MRHILSIKKFLDRRLNESVGDDLISKIDYTLLKPEATEEQIIELCEKADILGVKSVCVLPKMVKTAKEALKDSDVLVCTVVSFPHGTDTTEKKLAECKRVIGDGADEVDMVLNYKTIQGKCKIEGGNYNLESGDPIYDAAVNDVEALATECHKNDKILKVIVESGLLTEDDTAVATYICEDGAADFIKTSTGMVSVGAELDKVQVMRDIIESEGSDMKIKASGGIRTMADMQKFAPYVDRFGMGYTAVDSIFGGGEKVASGGY